MRKASIFIALFALLFAATGLRASYAVGACDLSGLAAELAAVQADTSLDEAEQLQAETAARRKLLEAAIECDKAEIAARVEALGSLPDNIKTSDAYRKILEGLGAAAAHHEEQKASIQGLGVWDLKSSARAMAAWRKETYIPLITWTDNLLLWSDNQQFLEKASERLGQISRVAFSLKLVNQDKVNDLFEKAQGDFDAAFAENDKAKKSLDQGRAGVGLIHLKASLKALADTYQIFFELQKALEEIVK